MRKLLLAAVLSVSLVGSVSGHLARRINGIIRQPSQSKVQFCIHIVKADSGKTVYDRNAHHALVPASNMKIITTAAALKFLGPDYEYKTKVGLCGKTLVVVGNGDPLLGDKATDAKHGRKNGWIFEDIARVLKNNGVTSVKDIIVDSSAFDDQRVHPNWPKEDLNKWYACEVSGLNFNANCIEVVAKNLGGNVVVTIEPQTSFVSVVNEVVPMNNGRGVIGAYRNQEPNKIIVKGKCENQVGPFAVAIERPAAFFGYLLAENLQKSGISTQGRLIEKALGQDCNFRALAEYSTPIADCLARSNKDSLGLAAEALLKTIAADAHADKKNGSWVGGCEVISRYLLELGVGEAEFYIDDASGLSRHNKLSANTITTVLLDVYQSSCWETYKHSLAVGGVDGTIGRYFKEKQYKGRILGKTGYIRRVKSFSGSCTTTEGDYLFSILANNTNGRTRAAINDIAKAIVDHAGT